MLYTLKILVKLQLGLIAIVDKDQFDLVHICLMCDSTHTHLLEFGASQYDCYIYKIKKKKKKRDLINFVESLDYLGFPPNPLL